MGTCSSCESTSVATAKLVLQDGRLQEFSYPVKVSHVLQRDPSCFICNSDELNFDDVVAAVSDDDELQLGQLYFALPLSRLRCRIQAEEMAALAVKASSSLMKSGEKCGSRRLPFSPVMLTGPKVLNRYHKVADGSGGGGGDDGLMRGRGVGGHRGRTRRRSFTAELGAIPE